MKDVSPSSGSALSDSDSTRALLWLPAWWLMDGLFSLVWLLLIPADTKNSLLWGYSVQRLALMAAVLLPTLAVGWLAMPGVRQQAVQRRIAGVLAQRSGLYVIAGWFLLCAGAFFVVWNMPGSAYVQRLLPLAAWLTLVSGHALWFAAHTAPLREALLRVEKFPFGLLQRPMVQLVLVVLLAFPLQMQNALRFEFPVGVAGLYALMAEQISNQQFALPATIPFYGPGGVPFAYPPLAFYVMAFFTGVMRVAALDYLRFAAPLFSLLGIIPMYLLARRISGSGWVAMLAALFLAMFGRIYLIHGQAAGMCRALGFLLALTGLYFFYGALRRFNWRDALLATLFFGLTVMTHPSYAELFAVSALAFVFSPFEGPAEPLKKRFAMGALVALGGALVAMPWWLTVLLRHGSGVFGFASNSHDSLEFLHILQDPAYAIALMSDFIYKLTKTPLLASAAILGLLWCAATRRWLLVVWFVAYVLIFGGYDFLAIPVVALLAAGMVEELGRNAAQRAGAAAALVFALLVVGLSYYSAYHEIARYAPDINNHTLEVSAWVQHNTPEDASFLRITPLPEEAEWYPYLLRRDPTLSSWGGEWTGKYRQQFAAVKSITACAVEQSLSCIETVLTENQAVAQYLLTNTGDARLKEELAQSGRWALAFENPGYQVWAKR